MRDKGTFTLVICQGRAHRGAVLGT